MQLSVDGGGVTTVTENRTHAIWPCVPHGDSETCEAAQRRVLGEDIHRYQGKQLERLTDSERRQYGLPPAPPKKKE